MGAHGELDGKVAVITGVTRHAGLGAAIARELIDAGACVFTAHFRAYDERQTWGVAANEPQEILRALGSRSDGIELDLSEPAAAVALFDRAAARFGPVDILINNAAHWEPAAIDGLSAEQLDRHYAVNLRAPVLLCSEFVRRWRPRAGGRIINVTSGQGRSPMPGELAYAVTKAGLDALTLSLAAGLESSGVTVNAVDPGPIDTGWMSPDLRASLASASPSGSLAQPRDLATVVRLLCANAAARITGRIVRIQAEGALESLRHELRNAPVRTTFEHAHPILKVASVARSLRYYVDVLGFSNAAWGGDDFTCVSRGGASIYLSEGDQGQPGTWVWLGVDDAHALYEEYRQSGATILQRPEEFPWACEMKVGDPDGHVLRFGSDPRGSDE
jgi:3-oxoacyl-[acyl-carrier protein] reductase